MTHPNALDCPACDGLGVVTNTQDCADARGEHYTRESADDCEDCGGSGKAACECGAAATEEHGGELLCALHAKISRARGVKVAKIVAKLPADLTAAALAAMPQIDRDLLAAQAGCRRPSVITWRMVVAAAQVKRAAEDERRRHLRGLMAIVREDGFDPPAGGNRGAA